MNPNVSWVYSTFANTFHVNPQVAERLHDRYISALSQVHNAPTEHSSRYFPSPVFDQRDAIAIVASQDGRLSVLVWDQTQGKVAVIRPAEFALL